MKLQPVTRFLYQHIPMTCGYCTASSAAEIWRYRTEEFANADYESYLRDLDWLVEIKALRYLHGYSYQRNVTTLEEALAPLVTKRFEAGMVPAARDICRNMAISNRRIC